VPLHVVVLHFVALLLPVLLLPADVDAFAGATTAIVVTDRFHSRYTLHLQLLLVLLFFAAASHTVSSEKSAQMKKESILKGAEEIATREQ
jgi:hypothetical protein